jgi:hypothetical protein
VVVILEEMGVDSSVGEGEREREGEEGDRDILREREGGEWVRGGGEEGREEEGGGGEREREK